MPRRPGQALRLHAVVGSQHHGFENVAFALVVVLGRVLRDGAALLGEGEVGVARA